MRLSNDDRRREARGWTRDDTRHACGCSDALVGNASGFTRLRRRRARDECGGQPFKRQVFVFPPKTEILDHAFTRFSSQALGRRRCGVSPGSLTLGRAECSPRDSPRSCRGSRARSASTADARSTPLAPLAPEHACVPAGVVDPDTEASFRRVPFSSETAATASGPPPA